MTTNYAKIKTICDELVQAGQPVSIESVLKACEQAEEGSTAAHTSVILAHYQRWRSEAQETKRGSGDSLNLSDEYMAAFQREIKRFSSALNRDSESRLEQAIEAEKFAILSLQKAEQVEDELAQRVKVLEERLEQEVTEFKATIAEVEDNADAEIASLKSHHEQQIEQVTASKNQIIEELKANSERTIEQLKQNHEATLSELKQSTDATISELRKTGEEKVSEVTEAIARQVSELEAAISEKDRKIQDLIQEKNDFNSQLSELQHKASSHAQVAEETSSELEKLREAKTQLTQQLQQTHSQIEMLKKQNLEMTQHSQEQSNFVKGAKEQLETLQARLAEAEKVSSSFAAEKDNMLKQMDFIKNNSTATIQRLTQNSDANLAKIRLLEEKLGGEQDKSWKLENENDKLLEQLEFIKQNSATTVERLTRSAEKAMARVRELERDVDDAKLALEQAKSNVVVLQEQKA